MDDALRARHASALNHWVGPPGRSIDPGVAANVIDGFSPAVVFNARVCVRGGKVWWGDLDLTEDEANLGALAEDMRETIFVLRPDEDQERYDEEFLESRAVYWVNPGGGTGHSRAFVERPDMRLAARVESSPPPSGREQRT